jgi:hypothetical protein
VIGGEDFNGREPKRLGSVSKGRWWFLRVERQPRSEPDRTRLQSGRVSGDARRSEVRLAYAGADAIGTRRLLRRLEQHGPTGAVAARLFWVQKPSSRAKVYWRSRSGEDFRALAYQRKGKALRGLCTLLDVDGAGFDWGWGRDPKCEFAPHVLYLELPQGQVSFHPLERFDGPDYVGSWDGQSVSEERILRFCESVLEEPLVPLS